MFYLENSVCLYYAYESPQLAAPVVDRCVHTVIQLENQALLCLRVFVWFAPVHCFQS